LSGIDDLRAAELRDAELLIVLGAPIGACEEDKYPLVRDEIALIDRRLSTSRPLLGICLGAQLFARRSARASIRVPPRKSAGRRSNSRQRALRA
jgi:GMP synthase (glutamine-hydrolysing)